MLKLVLLVLVVSALPQQGWGQTANDEGLEFFEQKVRPLLVEKCFECHSQGAENPKGGLRLDSKSAIVSGGDNGPAAVPGAIDESLLIRAVRYEDADIEMPPDGKLTPREIDIFEEWIRRGVPYPDTTAAASVRKKVDIEEGRKHWAFQPLSQHHPELLTDGWQHNRVDAFIRAKQAEQDLKPADAAPRAKLLRRAKFDLLGMPPTAEEVEQFIADGSVNAFEKCIDRWLASPRYGERWARFWLELARYCDIAESWAETQGNAYLYRDWVVAAINEDMPFDRFSTMQLAADQMPDAEPTDLAALGFLGLSPTYWKELQLPVEIIKTIVSDEYEERVHTFSSTFLGLNIACARCHDHKFDPITVQDYYALAGVFASTRAADRALVRGVDSLKVFEARQQVTKWEAEVKKLQAEVLALAAKPSDGPQSDENRKRVDASNEQLAKLTAQIEMTKALPGFELRLAPGAIDATLDVRSAENTHGSRIVYEERPRDLAVEIRGNPNKPGEVVPRGFVSVLSPETPARFTKGSGRLELSQCLFSDSSPLVARVFVNRIWKRHFGVGLVETPSDFGIQGQPPTHPELLDELASRFIAQGWSIKSLHRDIMLSATYQQACHSTVSDEASRKTYAGLPLRRLEVEQWRDAMLIASGAMDFTMGGPPIELSESQHVRRTLYGTVKRRELTDLLRLNDFPDPVTHSPTRIPTTTPLQQLYTLNSPFMQQQASELVARLNRETPGQTVDSTRQRIVNAYRVVFGRSPTHKECDLGLSYVRDNDPATWQQYCQVLLGSNEFLFID